MRSLVVAILFLLFVEQTSAQFNYATLSFQLSFPQGDYKQTYPKTGSGILFGIMHQMKNESFEAGGDIGLLQVSNANKRYEGSLNGNYFNYYVSATNYIITIAPKARVHLLYFKNNGSVFVDGTIGTNMFLTYGAISHNEAYNILIDDYNLKIDSSVSHVSWALRAGIGIGMVMPLNKKNTVALIIKGSYLYGGRVTYYANPAIHDLSISFEEKLSFTSMFLAEAGIRFDIFNKEK
jgi:hypothetical protein